MTRFRFHMWDYGCAMNVMKDDEQKRSLFKEGENGEVKPIRGSRGNREIDHGIAFCSVCHAQVVATHQALLWT